MNPSLVGVGAFIVTLLNLILPFFGIEADRGTVEQSVEGLLNFIGFVLLIWGQARRPDVDKFIFKK